MSKKGHSVAVYLLPGMSVKIKAPDYFIKHGQVRHMHKDGTVSDRTLEQGFVVDDEEVGEIKAVAEEPAVTYKHKKFSENVITFYALTGEKGYVYIISVPIHSHASVVDGGPAYGTYFSDDETVSSEI
jgi:hypothetical protein